MENKPVEEPIPLQKSGTSNDTYPENSLKNQIQGMFICTLLLIKRGERIGAHQISPGLIKQFASADAPCSEQDSLKDAQILFSQHEQEPDLEREIESLVFRDDVQEDENGHVAYNDKNNVQASRAESGGGLLRIALARGEAHKEKMGRAQTSQVPPLQLELNESGQMNVEEAEKYINSSQRVTFIFF